MTDISFDRFVEDLEAVFDAAKVDKAPVFGISFGAAVATAFAATRPDRVSGLVLINGFVQGMASRNRPSDAALGRAFMELARDGWNDEYPSSRDLFAQTFSPEANPVDQRTYAQFVKLAIDHADYLRIGGVVDAVDITDLLPQVRCPALVLHGNRERMQNKDQGRRLAAGMPNARFIGLDTANNLMPVYDPVWPKALTEIKKFLSEL